MGPRFRGDDNFKQDNCGKRHHAFVSAGFFGTAPAEVRRQIRYWRKRLK